MSDDSIYLHIPASLLTLETLKVLKLRHCLVSNLSSITGLKSPELLLGDMYITTHVMGLLCCHCESPRYLTLENCVGFKNIIVDPTSNLKALTLNGPETLKVEYIN